MIYSCPKAGYLLCDFPLSQRECKFLFNRTHLQSASSSPGMGTRAGCPGETEQVCIRNHTLRCSWNIAAQDQRGNSCHSNHPGLRNWNVQILRQGKWMTKHVKDFSTSTHVKWDAAATMQDVLSVENRQTGRDSVIWYPRADLIFHEKFQVYFSL